MIADLDKSIRLLLEKSLPDFSTENIRFEAPDDQFAPPLPAVNLFLYDVRENTELRSNEWTMERTSKGQVVQKPPPVRVECSYLITAWAGDVESEHHLLSDVMYALLRHPTIPPDLLNGSLQNQTPPLPAITLQAGRLQSLGEFWQALGGKPKAALHYTVTISLDVFKAVRTPSVLEKVISISPEI